MLERHAITDERHFGWVTILALAPSAMRNGNWIHTVRIEAVRRIRQPVNKYIRQSWIVELSGALTWCLGTTKPGQMTRLRRVQSPSWSTNARNPPRRFDPTVDTKQAVQWMLEWPSSKLPPTANGREVYSWSDDGKWLKIGCEVQIQDSRKGHTILKITRVKIGQKIERKKKRRDVYS